SVSGYTIASRKLRLKSPPWCEGWRIAGTELDRAVVISKTDWIGSSDSFGSERHVCPGIKGGRGTIIKAGLPLIKVGGEHCHASGVDQIVFQRGHIRIPVHANRRFARVIRLARPAGIIHIAGRRAWALI